MPVVWNPTEELVSTKMQGSWFTFKPNSRKVMENDKCQFIESNRKETGLVILPTQFDPISDHYVEGYEKTEEGKKILVTLKEQGIENLLAFHKDIIRNNQVALRKDIAKANPQGDPARLIALEMSKGEIESLKLVSKYQKANKDNADMKIKEIQKMLEEAGPIGD